MTERPLSPEERMATAYSVGRGIYSGLQLKNVLLNAGPKEEEEEKLVVKIPKIKLQKNIKHSSLEKAGTTFPEHVLAIGQILRGINDKSKEHYDAKHKNLQHELDKAQAHYIKSLTQQKEASLKKEATPHVDALCMGMLNILEKQALETISDGSVKRTLKNIAHPITKHFPSVHKIKQTTIDTPILASALATWVLKGNLNKEEAKTDKKPLNIQIEAI